MSPLSLTLATIYGAKDRVLNGLFNNANGFVIIGIVFLEATDLFAVDIYSYTSSCLVNPERKENSAIVRDRWLENTLNGLVLHHTSEVYVCPSLLSFFSASSNG